MKLIILLPMTLLVLSSSTYSQQLTSRFGALELKASEDSDQPRLYGLVFNDKEILQLEGYPVEIIKVLHGTGRDYVIVTKYSGGIACPVVVVVVDLSRSGPLAISEEFGSCSDLIRTRLIRGRVIIEMPTYTPHPEFFSKKELRERNSTKQVYTWYKSKLSMKTLPR